MLEFTQIHNKLKPDPFEVDQYVRGGTKGGKPKYYAHASLPTNPSDSDAAVERRKRKYVEGARIVKDALSKQYGDSVTGEVLLKVGEAVHRDLAQGVTRGDLDLLHEELHRPETLQNRARNDETAEVIKDRLAGGWAFAAIEPRRPVRWLDSNTEVELRSSVEKCLEHSKMQFSEQGTLTLTQGERGNSDANKSALTRFIGEHFKVASGDPVAPGQRAFQNIANNVLSYLPLLGQYVLAKMHRVAGGGVCSSVDDAKGTFTLSVKDNGNIGVAGGTNIRFRMGDDAVSRFDWSKYRFVRQEGFEISGDQLRSDQFNPKASLVSVDRFDTVELAD